MTFLDNFTDISYYVNNELKNEVINVLENIIEQYILTQTKYVNDDLLLSKTGMVHISLEIQNNKIFCLGYKGSSLLGENVKSELVKIDNEKNITFEKIIHKIVEKEYLNICDKIMKKIFTGLCIDSHYSNSSLNEITIGYIVFIKKRQNYRYSRLILDNEED
jgi:hypothetical protein